MRQRLGQYPQHGIAWVERSLRVLEHHLDSLPCLALLRSRQRKPILPGQLQAALLRPLQPQQDAPQRALAGTGLAHHTKGLPGAQLQRHTVQHLTQPTVRPDKGLAQATRLQHHGLLVHAILHQRQGRRRRTFEMYRPSRAQQALGVGVLRVLQDLFDTALLHHHPMAHNRHPVGQARDHGQVMADHQQAVVALAQVLKQVENLRLHCGVQRGGGFVSDQQAWLTGDGRGDQGALPEASGELPRVLPGTDFGLRHPDLAQ